MSLAQTELRSTVSSSDQDHGVGRLAGVAGLVFALTLVIQNLLRASSPALGADPAKVIDYFEHHRVAVLIPLGLFPLGMVAIIFFVSGIWIRAHESGHLWWASVGALAVALIAALFAIVNITEIVLAAKAHALAPSPDVVRALWAVHAAAFGLDLAAIALALVGLSQAARASGLVRRWIAVAALPGAACLFSAGIFTVSIANGGPWMFALVGFIIWGVFIVVCSIALLHRQPDASTSSERPPS
jgi:hypothetical protein